MLADRKFRVPWHIWPIGGILLLYGLLAGYDSAMTLTQGEAYMRASGMTDSQVAFFTGFPVWVQMAGFVSTWGGLIGATLLLLRRQTAVVTFFVAAFATLATCAYLYSSAGGIAAMGVLWPMPAIIALAFVAAAFYSAWLARRGVLKRG